MITDAQRAWIATTVRRGDWPTAWPSMHALAMGCLDRNVPLRDVQEVLHHWCEPWQGPSMPEGTVLFTVAHYCGGPPYLVAAIEPEPTWRFIWDFGT